MNDNVVSLNGGPTGERSVDESVVSTARDLLERAEAGEVIGLALAVLNHDGTANYGCAGYLAGYKLLGALTCVQGEIVEKVSADD